LDGETGYLVEARNSQVMADKILDLLSRPALLKKMGDAGRKRVEDFFSWDRVTDRYEALYQEVLKR
jgi:glycosyltransferase involved in cell wall biosynthesis